MTVKKFQQLLLLLIFVLFSQWAGAEITLSAEGAWVRQPPPNATTTAGYVLLKNSGAADYYITGAESPRYGAIELHRTIHDNGMARMQRQNYLVVPAQGEVALKPGDYHLMLFRQKGAISAGEIIPITLKLGNGDDFALEFTVKRKASD